MSILLILLLVAAVICFACAAVGVVSKFNLTAAGLFFWALTQLLPLLLRLGCVMLACAIFTACSTAQRGMDTNPAVAKAFGLKVPYMVPMTWQWA